MTIADEALSRLGELDRNRVNELVAAIPDPELRRRIGELIGKAIGARQRLTLIDLKPFEAAHHDLSGLDIWKSLAPQMGEALRAVSLALDSLAELAPPPEEAALGEGDLDLAFAEFDAPLQPGAYEPPRDKRAQELDGLMAAADLDQAPPSPAIDLVHLGDTAWAVSAVLRDEMLRFGGRMRQSAVVLDRWNLLAEVQETRHKLTKGLDALVMGICSVIAPVRRDEVIPGFHTELAASLELRHLITDLRQTLRGIRAQLDREPPERWAALAQPAYSALEQFVFGPVFGWLRALDKREITQLRRRVRAAVEVGAADANAVRESVEGTVRFLEALQVINQREILVDHDRRVLREAQANLELALGGAQSRPGLAKALGGLAKVYGRDEDLDRLVEAALDPLAAVDAREILARVQALLARL